MDVSVILSVITLIGVVGGAIFAYLQTRSSNKKDLMIDDRETAREIREELRSEIKQLRDEIAIWRTRSLHLEDQLREWKDKYASQELDYMKALDRIVELERKLNERSVH